MTINAAQQVFLVFFAIFWSTSSNAWPRWKPFNWPLVRDRRVLLRVLVSIVSLNVVPAVYFAWMLSALGREPPQVNWNGLLFWQTIRGIAPSFAVFGFYRIWMAIIECCPDWFYYSNADMPEKLRPKKSCNADGIEHPLGWIEPAAESIPLRSSAAGANLAVGLTYVLLGTLVACLLGN